MVRLIVDAAHAMWNGLKYCMGLPAVVTFGTGAHAYLYFFMGLCIQLLILCFLTSMRRQKALDIYFKLHVDSPYVTYDKQRQVALAEYTGQDTKKVNGGSADLSST